MTHEQFTQIYLPLCGKMYALAYTLLRNRNAARDRVQYIGHLYGAIALDFDSPNGWLVYQPYSKTEDGGMLATNTYILVNHERFVIYRCLNPLTSDSRFSPTELCRIVRDESRFPIPRLE